MSEKSNEACWYVVHTYSGYENKVKDTLEKSIKSSNMQDYILMSACLLRKSPKSARASV